VPVIAASMAWPVKSDRYHAGDRCQRSLIGIVPVMAETTGCVAVSIEAKAPHRITVKGLIKEKTFKFSNLETWAGVSVVPGERSFHVHDELRNLSDYERPYQVIYHANFGAPLLEGGAHFRAAAKEVIPFNDYAKQGLADWQTYLPVTPGFDEMVFNIWPFADANARAAIRADSGVQAAYLGELVDAHPQLALAAPVAMNICCFRYQAQGQDGQASDALNDEIVVQLQLQGSAAPSTTVVNGRSAIRVNITNHRTTRADLAYLVQEVERIAQTLLSAPGTS